jgi:hypothetical protein
MFHHPASGTRPAYGSAKREVQMRLASAAMSGDGRPGLLLSYITVWV